MNKLLSTLIIGTVAIGCVLCNSINTNALEIERVQEKYAVRWETDQKFLVTEITPSTGYLTMVYTDIDHTGLRVSNANIVWEKEKGVGDLLVSTLGIDKPDWAQTAFNREIRGTAFFVDKYEQTFAAPETDLTENVSGVLYYYITINKSAKDSVYGRVDYSMCLNSPLYKDGVTCRLEKTKDGGMTYYPYYDGERLEEVAIEETESSDIVEDEKGNEETTTEDILQDNTGNDLKNEQAAQRTDEVFSNDTENYAKVPIAKASKVIPVENVATKKSITQEQQSASNKDNDSNNEQKNLTVPALGEVTQDKENNLWWVVVLSGMGLVMFCGFAIIFCKRKRDK